MHEGKNPPAVPPRGPPPFQSEGLGAHDTPEHPTSGLARLESELNLRIDSIVRAQELLNAQLQRYFHADEELDTQFALRIERLEKRVSDMESHR